MEGVCVHLAGKISKICLRDTCSGWYPGQVNVMGLTVAKTRFHGTHCCQDKIPRNQDHIFLYDFRIICKRVVKIVIKCKKM